MTWQPWCAAWQIALYRPGTGFYRRYRANRHFATSVAGVPGGAGVLARALVALAAESDLETVVEIGCGSGALLTQLGAHGGSRRALGIEVHPRPPGLPGDVEWLRAPGGAGLPRIHDRFANTLLVAHEWLDVVPCPVLEVDASGSPRVVEVERRSGQERLAGDPTPADEDWCRRHWPCAELRPGARIEVGRTRDEAWAQVLELLGSGTAVAVDYGHEAGRRPVGGTLAGFAEGRQVAPRPDGSCDITAHVAVDSLAHDEILTQREALLRLGAPPTLPDPGSAAEDPGSYLRSLTATAGTAALCDPDGAGSFLWVVTHR